jgi:hypothetical protein
LIYFPDLNVTASDIISGGGINIRTDGKVNIKNITLEKSTYSTSHTPSSASVLNPNSSFLTVVFSVSVNFCAVILTSPCVLPKI